MTPSDRAPGAPLPQSEIDRNALAKALLDVICPPHLKPIDALFLQLDGIAGAAGYLSSSASVVEFELSPLPGHLAGLGQLIESAANIARVLADETQAILNRMEATS